MAHKYADDLTAIYAPHLAKIRRPKGKRKIKVSMNGLHNASKVLMRKLVEKYHWELVEDDEKADLLWTDNGAARKFYRAHHLFKKINHLPGMQRNVDKASLDRLLNIHASLYPDEFDFFPMSWDCTREFRAFEKRFKKDTTYIFKPSSGRQGLGICLAQTWDDVIKIMPGNPRHKYVVQEYLDKPLLIDGYKFDLRIYAMVESVKPLKVHVFRDGLARLCTSKYEAPNRSNLDKAYMHFTNYSLNKKSSTFQDVETDQAVESEDNLGSKRSIRTALIQLQKQGVDIDVEKFWRDVEDIVAKTCIALWPAMWSSFLKYYPGAHAWSFDPTKDQSRMPGSQCFHILGFDVLIDANLKPWLLEVNASPSFGTGSVVDLKVKQSVVERSMDIIGLLKTRDSSIHRRKMKRLKEKRSASVGGSPRLSPAPAPSDLGADEDDHKSITSDVSHLRRGSMENFASLLSKYSKKKRGRGSSRRSSGRRAKSVKKSSRSGSMASGKKVKMRRSKTPSASSRKSRTPKSLRVKQRDPVEAELDYEEETGDTMPKKSPSQAYLNGLNYLRALRNNRSNGHSSMNKKLSEEAWESVNFIHLDYTSLRPGYTHRNVFIYGDPVLQKVFADYTNNNFAAGLSNSTKLTRLLSKHQLLNSKALSRVDIELQYMKMIKGAKASTMHFGLFCEFILWVAGRIHKDKPPLRQLQLVTDVIREFQAVQGSR